MPYLAIFTGNAHPELAKTVADHLHIPLGRADVTRFSDGEIADEIKEHVVKTFSFCNLLVPLPTIT